MSYKKGDLLIWAGVEGRVLDTCIVVGVVHRQSNYSIIPKIQPQYNIKFTFRTDLSNEYEEDQISGWLIDSGTYEAIYGQSIPNWQ